MCSSARTGRRVTQPLRGRRVAPRPPPHEPPPPQSRGAPMDTGSSSPPCPSPVRLLTAAHDSRGAPRDISPAYSSPATVLREPIHVPSRSSSERAERRRELQREVQRELQAAVVQTEDAALHYNFPPSAVKLQRASLGPAHRALLGPAGSISQARLEAEPEAPTLTTWSLAEPEITPTLTTWTPRPLRLLARRAR